MMTNSSLYREINWDQELNIGKEISGILQALSAHGFLNPIQPGEDMFRQRFAQLNTCQAPFTAFTPSKVRFVYEITFAANPRNLLGLGTFAGVGFLPSVAGAVDRDHLGNLPLHQAVGVAAYGVDVDARSTQIATENSQQLGLENQVKFTTQDAFAFVSELKSSIDYVFIDIDEPGIGKHRYTELFEAVAPLVRPGGLVIADDTFVPKFRKDLVRYHDRIRNHPCFTPPILIPIDAGGLSLTFKLEG